MWSQLTILVFTCTLLYSAVWYHILNASSSLCSLKTPRGLDVKNTDNCAPASWQYLQKSTTGGREERIISVCDKLISYLHLYSSVTYRVKNVHQCHSRNSGDDQQKFLSAEIIILRSEEKRGNPRVIPHEQENCSAPSSYHPPQRSHPFLLLLSLSPCACLSVYPSISPSAPRCAQSGMESSVHSQAGLPDWTQCMMLTPVCMGLKPAQAFTTLFITPTGTAKQLKAQISQAQWGYREGEKETATLRSWSSAHDGGMLMLRWFAAVVAMIPPYQKRGGGMGWGGVGWGAY